MTTISHEPSARVRERPDWFALLSIPELWATLSIVVMWLAVLFDGIYGPDIVSNGGGAGAGGGSTVPSVVVVALFAFLGTAGVAKHGFRRDT